ncbi:MAG: DUF3313 family protein [Chromatiales bacterium]|nr:MAG: DUF3313 family protein [Chromatiales bacterium]
MFPKTLRLLVPATLILLFAGTALARQEDLPEVTEDGLHRVHDSRAAIGYAKPGANLSGYRQIQLLDAYVAFKKNWERDQRSSSASSFRISSKDIEEIKNDLAQEFRKVFQEVLDSSGYTVVGAAGDDVLLIRPAIINLDVNAPDTMSAGRSRTYTDSAGEMTLYIELYDSVTGDLIAKAMDRKVDGSNRGFYTWANRATNRVAADRILKGWAEILVEALNEARATPAGAGDPADAE